MKFNPIAYYLSQYFWSLYIIIPLLLSLLITKHTKKVTIYSSTQKYDISKDPIIFAHLSDTHINVFRPESISSFQRTVQVIKSYSPEFILHTGDIVDNYDSIKLPRYADQNEASWKVYKDESSIINNIPIIEVGGNHDMFGVKNYDSPHNFLIDYSHSFTRNNTKSEIDFLVRSFKVGPSNTNIIAVNPYDFPTLHAPIIKSMRLSTRALDLIQEEVNKSDTKSVIICHYPVGSISSQKSTKGGKKLVDFVDSKSDILAYLSGHWHFDSPSAYYYGKGGVDIVGTASFKRSKFGLVTIDNDGISWSPIDIRNPPNGIVSYPIPMEQVSINSIFNDIENSEIRVVIFSDQKDLKIGFTIKDLSNSKTVFDGYLSYSRPLINGHSLYTYPMKDCLDRHGSYHITFSGDFNGSLNFVIKDSIVSAKKEIGYFTGLFGVLPYLFCAYLVILLLITFFIPFNCFNCQVNLDAIEEWIEMSGNKGKLSYWLLSIFGGFLLVRSRFLQIPLAIQICAFALVAYSLFGPLYFYQIEDLTGFLWLYGYFVNKKNLESEDGILYATLYLALVCTPIILLCSNLGVKVWSKWQILDLVVFGICLALDLVVVFTLVHQSAGFEFVGSSMAFVVLPFVFIVIFIVWQILIHVSCNCCDNEDEYAEDLTQHLNTLPTQVII
ncbi:Transmembrane protein 62 [Tritrichomonas musculus]|uniref:Transmembrane protein 62 n=1 Tax=Tritrichomonas musculus TaxID=1915356 RepID=A0ABR2KN77_9EUKA